jgi:DNA adenine methylase
LAHWVIGHFPRHRAYVEAFGGAGSVLMKKRQSIVEVYNDLSDEMVNLFRVLRNREMSAELRRLLDLTPWSRSEWLSCYEPSGDIVEQARRTVVLCAQGHNPSKALNRRSNGWRSSSSGNHRLPQDFQAYTAALTLITDRLKGVLIENRPAEKVCRQHDRISTLHYLDPPYPGATRSTNNGNYYQHELRRMEQHEELAGWANDLRGMVVVSGYDCDEYDQWFGGRGWKRVATTATTGAAGGGSTGKSTIATEVLWLNPLAASMQKQLGLF